MEHFVPPLPRPRWSRFRVVGTVVLALLVCGALYFLDAPSGWVRWLIVVLVIIGLNGLYEIVGGGLDDSVLWNREIAGAEARHVPWRRMLWTILGLGLVGLLVIWLAGKLL